MSYILDTFARAAFKRMIGKSHTSNTRDPANEPISSAFTLSAQNIWGRALNPVPGHSSNVGLISDLITLTLEPVSGTANSGKYASYRCKLGASVPASLVGKINRQTGVAYAINDYVGDIIPSQFGDGFRPKLFKGAVETPPLDASDWFLDTSAGVITQEEDVTGSMIDYSTTGTVQCYVYTGPTAADSIQAGATQFYDYQTVGNGITGATDGVNKNFTLANVPSGIPHVYINGILTSDFTMNSAVITLGSQTASLVTDAVTLTVNYRV